uniref:Exported protein n=1 Tax=Strongyloides stercoralis TaxID=6248 RepID=A0A0K0EFF1_STRER
MYKLLTALLYLSFATFSTGELSLSYLNRQCKPTNYSKEFECPKLYVTNITIDIATFYQPINGDCSSNCSAIPSYEKKVIHNGEWIILFDGSGAYKVNPLLYNPHCYPEKTFIVNGNVPVSLLKDRISFDSTYKYILKEGAPIFSLIPGLGRHKDQAMIIGEKQFFMFLTMYLMRSNNSYYHETHHKDVHFYDAATDNKLKVNELSVDKANELLENMYYDTIEELIKDSADKWSDLCEDAITLKGQFYEEVMFGIDQN